MKKQISMLLATACAASLLAACGGPRKARHDGQLGADERARVLPAQREKRGISQRDAKKCRRRSLRHRRERRRRVLTGEKNETVR